MRMARTQTFAVGLFIVVMALTPLSAITSGGIHETWIRSEYGRAPVRVVLEDRTGLVRAIAAFTPDGPQPRLTNGDDARTLVLHWFDWCPAYQLNVTFSSVGDRYRLRLAADVLFCSFYDLPSSGTIAIRLSHPVDAAAVDITPTQPEMNSL
jgi:hypothetical protein